MAARCGSKIVKPTKKKKEVKEPTTQKEIYKKYMRSKEWEVKRNEFRNAYGNKCKVCDSTDELHIHHWNYDNLKNETLDDVICLCKSCHFRVHDGLLNIQYVNEEEAQVVIKYNYLFRNSKVEFVFIKRSDNNG